MFAVASLLLALLPATAQTQNPPKEIKISIKHDLEFGQVISGIVYRVDPSDNNAAAAEVESEEEYEVFLRFILPSSLVGPSGSSLPLEFDDTSAILAIEGKKPEDGDYFDPWTPLNFTSRGDKGKSRVWVGGTLEVPHGALSGIYQATVIIECGYTGT